MFLEKVEPALVSQRRGQGGRADDVGEENRRQNPIRPGRLLPSGQELLDRVEGRSEIAGVKRESVGALHDSKLGTGDSLGDVFAEGNAMELCLSSGDNERWHGDEGEGSPDVDLGEPIEGRLDQSERNRHALVPGPPVAEAQVVGNARGGQFQHVARGAVLSDVLLGQRIGGLEGCPDGVVVGPEQVRARH